MPLLVDPLRQDLMRTPMEYCKGLQAGWKFVLELLVWVFNVGTSITPTGRLQQDWLLRSVAVAVRNFGG
jgi:hypothetical protein